MTLQMLSHPPGSYKPISYEQMYSAVYKCVCKQYSDQLYADLMTHVNTRLAQWSSNLGSVADDNFILEFHKALVQYFHALGGIVPIFTYMNRLVKNGAVVVNPLYPHPELWSSSFTNFDFVSEFVEGFSWCHFQL